MIELLIKNLKEDLKLNKALELRKMEKERYFNNLENKRKSVLGTIKYLF